MLPVDAALNISHVVTNNFCVSLHHWPWDSKPPPSPGDIEDLPALPSLIRPPHPFLLHLLVNERLPMLDNVQRGRTVS